MRSIWKGHIRFLFVAIPVRVYNAVEASEKIQFNQLHREDFGPIGYDKRCKKCGQLPTTFPVQLPWAEQGKLRELKHSLGPAGFEWRKPQIILSRL